MPRFVKIIICCKLGAKLELEESTNTKDQRVYHQLTQEDDLSEWQLDQWIKGVSKEPCSSSQLMAVQNTKAYTLIPRRLFNYFLASDNPNLTHNAKLLYLILFKWANIFNFRLNNKKYFYENTLSFISAELGACLKTTKKTLAILKALGYLIFTIEKSLNGEAWYKISLRFPTNELKDLYAYTFESSRSLRLKITLRATILATPCSLREFERIVLAPDEPFLMLPHLIFKYLCQDKRLSKQAKLVFLSVYSLGQKNKFFSFNKSHTALGLTINLIKRSRISWIVEQLVINGYITINKRLIETRFPKCLIELINKSPNHASSVVLKLQPMLKDSEFETSSIVCKKYINVKKNLTIQINHQNIKRKIFYLNKLIQLDDNSLMQSCLKFFLSEDLTEQEISLQDLIGNMLFLALYKSEGNCSTLADAKAGLATMLSFNAKIQELTTTYGFPKGKSTIKICTDLGVEAEIKRIDYLNFVHCLREQLKEQIELNVSNHV